MTPATTTRPRPKTPTPRPAPVRDPNRELEIRTAPKSLPTNQTRIPNREKTPTCGGLFSLSDSPFSPSERLIGPPVTGLEDPKKKLIWPKSFAFSVDCNSNRHKMPGSAPSASGRLAQPNPEHLISNLPLLIETSTIRNCRKPPGINHLHFSNRDKIAVLEAPPITGTTLTPTPLPNQNALDSGAVNDQRLRSRSDRAILIAAAIVILVCLFSHLGAIGLTGPDEPRYAWIARDMAATGDWVTPRLYGRPWFEKPILYYWAAALGFRAHLPAEWAARLPSALAALAAALAIAWLGWRHDRDRSPGPPWSQSAAVWSPLIFATSVGAIGFARAAAPDMLFAAALALAMASAFSIILNIYTTSNRATGSAGAPRCGAAPLALFGAFLALAVLAKGPAGIILAAGSIALWALATRQWRATLRLAHPIALAAFCVVALPWYILCALRNPDFIQVFIFQHNFARYLTNEFQHRQPFWFFIPIALAALLPWTALLLPAARDGLHLWHQNSGGRSTKSFSTSLGFFAACWAAFPILFFSFSQSKLPGYILPAIPPASLVIALASAKRFQQAQKSRAWIPAALAATYIALLAALLYQLKIAFSADVSRFFLPLGLLALSFALAFAASWRYSGNRPQTPFVTAVIVALLFVEVAGRAVLPIFDPLLSARSAAALVSSIPLGQVSTFKLRRSWQFGLNFYLRRELPEWSPTDGAHQWVLTNDQGTMEILASGREVIQATSNPALGLEVRLIQVGPPQP